MGVKGFKQFIERKAPEVVTVVDSLTDFAGQTVAVDTAIYMYKAEYASDSDDGFLGYFLYHYSSLKAEGLHPVYVFDGEELPEKEREHAKRKHQRQQQLQRESNRKQQVRNQLEQVKQGCSSDFQSSISQLFQLKEQQRQMETKSSVLTVTPQHYSKLRTLFSELCIPYVIARAEAEKACCWMARRGLVDLVMTDDYDALPCGAPVVVRHYGSPRYSTAVIRLERVLSALELSREQFVDVCILAGCDFCCTLPRIGITRGYNMIKKHGSMEVYLQGDGRQFAHDVELMDHFTFYSARHLFLDTAVQIQELHFTSFDIPNVPTNVAADSPAKDSSDHGGPPMDLQRADGVLGRPTEPGVAGHVPWARDSHRHCAVDPAGPQALPQQEGLSPTQAAQGNRGHSHHGLGTGSHGP